MLNTHLLLSSLLLKQVVGPNPDQWNTAGQLLGNVFLHNKEIFTKVPPFLMVSHNRSYV